MNKIVVVGCGNVGMTYVFALINQINNIDEIVMIDKNNNNLEGEILDLNDTLKYSLNKIKISLGDYDDCKDASLICITAGINQTVGDRLNDLEETNKIFKEIIYKIKNSGFCGIYLVASNPLDVMTYLTRYYADCDYNKVLGSGTTLDSSRLSYFISKKLEINPKSIDCYVIGEHGNSEFVAWSCGTIAQQNINNFLAKEEMDIIETQTRTAGSEIVKRKGATFYGIAMCLVEITLAILSNEEIILPVSNYDKVNDVYFSSPCVINRNGIKERIYINLNSFEQEKLNKSIKIIKNAINSVIK